MGVVYGMVKVVIDKMMVVMVYELSLYNILVICLYFGLVRMEVVFKV